MGRYKRPRRMWLRREFWTARMFTVSREANVPDASLTTQVHVIAFFHGLKIEFTRPWDPSRGPRISGFGD